MADQAPSAERLRADDDYGQRVALRKVLCRRLHEHDFVQGGCDGVDVVCGFCDHTTRQQADAMKRATGGNHG